MPKKNYDLKLRGYVGGWDFDCEYVSWFLDKNKNQPVTIAIDSLGGSIVTAASIAAEIKNHGDVTVHYLGFNASAATVVSVGAKRVTIDRFGMYLVHQCSQDVFKWQSMNATEMEEYVKSLDSDRRELEKIDLLVAGMYAERCRKSQSELLELMKKGGWLTAEEAKAWGFVDEITSDPQEKPEKVSAVVADAMSREGIPALPGMSRKGLLERLADFVGFYNGVKDVQPINSYMMANEIQNVCSALGVDALEFNNELATLSREQVLSLENALNGSSDEIASLRARVKELEAQVEALRSQPGDQTTQVVNSTCGTPESRLGSFAEVARQALDMFNSIP